MARQAMDIVPLDEVGPMDYRFEVRGTRYRIHFEQGAWILDRFEHDELIETMEVGSLGDGIHIVLDES